MNTNTGELHELSVIICNIRVNSRHSWLNFDLISVSLGRTYLYTLSSLLR